MTLIAGMSAPLAFISFLLVRRLKIINGVNTPAADMRGRAFPVNGSKVQFEGPALVGGVLYKMLVYLNHSVDGRPYIRTVFSLPEIEVVHEGPIIP